MLLGMHVKNLALIDEMEIDFQRGLNILTGETGAGKSIILGSMNLALGEKVPKDLLREDKDAYVELIFSLESEQTRKLLLEYDIDVEEELVIFSRKISNGRSVGKVNGISVPASTMRIIASSLIHIYGQQEHVTLLNKSKHLDILDAYGGTEITKLKQIVAKTYEKYRQSKDQYEKAKLDEIEKHNLPVSDDELRMQVQNNHVHLVMPYCKIEELNQSDLTAKRKKKSFADSFKLGSQVKDFNPIKYGSEIKNDKPDLMNTKQNFLQFMRQEWCNFINNSLEQNNRIERYTHKSYKDLGLQISATTHEGEMVKSRVANGKKMDVHEYNKQQKLKQQTESDYLNFINVPLPKELAYKILSGEKLAEKELLDSLKAQPKSELEQAQDLLNQINNAHQLIDNKLADHEHEPLDLREKLDKLKESNSNNAPGATPQEPETLSQKLERLKQKQIDEKPKPTAKPKQQDNDNDYSPF